MKRMSNKKILKKAEITKTILACDPSLRAFGFVIITYDGKVIHGGCVKTESENKLRRIRKGDDDVRRLDIILNVLKKKISMYKVNYIVSELPHGSKSSGAAKIIGMMSGMMTSIAKMADVGIEFYSEGDAKNCLHGKSSSTKQETIDAIAKMYEVPWTGIKFRDEAIADSMAIYNVAINESPVLQFLKANK